MRKRGSAIWCFICFSLSLSSLQLSAAAIAKDTDPKYAELKKIFLALKEQNEKQSQLLKEQKEEQQISKRLISQQREKLNESARTIESSQQTISLLNSDLISSKEALATAENLLIEVSGSLTSLKQKIEAEIWTNRIASFGVGVIVGGIIIGVIVLSK